MGMVGTTMAMSSKTQKSSLSAIDSKYHYGEGLK
jgi:hypothetical protein